MSIDRIAPTPAAEAATIPEAPFHSLATGLVTRARCTLKYGDTFAVVDSHGDIGASAGGPDGLFHSDTRFLSYLRLSLNGYEPVLLGFNLRDDNTMLAVDLTNPDLRAGGQLLVGQHTLHIVRSVFLWREHGLSKAGDPQSCRSQRRVATHVQFRQRFRRPVRGARTNA
jgi:glycogen debranching enzyme